MEAARGKSGNREDETVSGCVSCPSPAAGKVTAVTGGEGSGDGEGSMAVRADERERAGARRGCWGLSSLGTEQ